MIDFVKENTYYLCRDKVIRKIKEKIYPGESIFKSDDGNEYHPNGRHSKASEDPIDLIVEIRGMEDLFNLLDAESLFMEFSVGGRPTSVRLSNYSYLGSRCGSGRFVEISGERGETLSVVVEAWNHYLEQFLNKS